jgi:hypothetical protein
MSFFTRVSSAFAEKSPDDRATSEFHLYNASRSSQKTALLEKLLIANSTFHIPHS